MEGTTALLERLAAAPRPYGIKMLYSDGTSEEVRQPHLGQAKALFQRYSAKIGRTFRLFDSVDLPRFVKLTAVELIGGEA